MDSYRYGKGESAYQAIDCENAIAHFDAIINSQRLTDTNDYVARARARKAECERFQSVMAQPIDQAPQTTWITYDDFLKRYPDSALSGAIQEQAVLLVAQNESTELAQLDVCDRLQSLDNNRLIPNRDTNLPVFYQACGHVYVEHERFDQAIALYEKFLAQYPNHEQFNAIETSLASTMVAQADAQGAGKIEPPPLSGYTTDGSTMVTIRNDSPQTMRIVLSGTDPQFKEIPPCETCQTFRTPPATCPERGPEATFNLSPGQYSVLVRSVSDRSVTPYTGDWAFDRGSTYYSCFYIVQTPASNPAPFSELPYREQMPFNDPIPLDIPLDEIEIPINGIPSDERPPNE
jgi:tetratricopeptide (TPR) repeat protein